MKIFPILTIALSSCVVLGWSVTPPFFGLMAVPIQAAQEAENPDKAESPPPAKKAQEPKKSGDSQKKRVVSSKAATASVQKAREALFSFQSIKTGIQQAVVIGGRKLKATGSYVQGADLKSRLEFEVKLRGQNGEFSGSVLQVCDGLTLWTVQKTGNSKDAKPRIARRDVRQILSAARNSAANLENVLIAELGLGGLPALLASLEQSMIFHSVKQREIKGKVLTVVEGKWNDKKYEQFLNLSKAARLKNPDRLPLHIPDSVQIFLDPENSLFPRRIVYLKRHPTKNYSRPMVTVAFTDIVLNSPVDDSEFEFVPPEGVPQDNITSRYLDRLKPASKPLPSSPSGSTLE